MTEDEAKTKWCPMGNCEHPEGGSFNRSVKDNPETYCIASDCMWWVWDIKWDSEGVIKEGEGHCGAIK